MNTTFTDYYALLGIRADADLDAIKAAYRRLAMQYHPDRGGSHEKMLLINEALRVLVNPTARADYDRWRNDKGDARAQNALQRVVRTAADEAANYPAHSKDIDTWMEALLKDFLAAEYGQWGRWPTVSNSSSGGVFLCFGAIAGALGSYYLSGQTMSSSGALKMAFFGTIAGAWIGQALHRQVRNSMVKNSSNAPSEKPNDQPLLQYAHVRCPKCGQQLRFVPNSGRVRLRCPTCQEAFALG